MRKSLKVFPEGVRLNNHALVVGFHGIGATGYWTVKFLIQQLKASRTCFIDYEHAPPVSSTVGGRISTPFEVYSTGDLSLLKAEVSPLRERENEFFRSLAEWIMSTGVKEVALVGGLDESLRTGSSNYRIVSTSALSQNGSMGDEPVLEEEKMIVGPVASLLNLFEVHDFPAFAILAFSNTERVDPRASATAIGFLAKRYSLAVDTSPLIKGAEAIESEMKVVEQKDSSTSVYS